MANLSSVIDYPISLDPAYGALKEINGEEIESYTLETFSQLILNQQGNPYYLAVTQDKGGSIHAFDGARFVRAKYKFSQNTSSLTRAEIIEGYIYRTEKASNGHFTFKQFCSLNQLRENHDHALKIMNASNPDLNPQMRGAERVYVAQIYEDAGNFEEANKWYRLACDEDHSYQAHFCLATCLLKKGLDRLTGNEMQELMTNLSEAYKLAKDGSCRVVARGMMEKIINYQDTKSYLKTRISGLELEKKQ